MDNKEKIQEMSIPMTDKIHKVIKGEDFQKIL